MKITPEEAERIAKKAMALEEDFEGGILACRPPTQRVRILVLEHARGQRRLRRAILLTHASGILGVGLAVALGALSILVVTAGSLLAGGVLLLAVERSSRVFEASLRQGVSPLPRGL